MFHWILLTGKQLRRDYNTYLLYANEQCNNHEKIHVSTKYFLCDTCNCYIIKVLYIQRRREDMGGVSVFLR